MGIAEIFSGAGSDLVLVARTRSQLSEPADFISKEYGRKVETISADLSRPDSLAEIVESAMNRFGCIDLLVATMQVLISENYFWRLLLRILEQLCRFS